MKERKEMNKEIGNWYWLFSQTIYLYGTNTTDKNKFKVYHGINVKLLFPSFTPSFDCPISTTTQFEVAQGFASNGIILELKPSNSSHDKYLSVYWLSAYPHEYEYLFASASHLSICNIRFNSYKFDITYSFEDHLNAMRLFDFIVNKKCSYSADNNINNNLSQQLLLQYLTFTG
eukprot:440589_1